MIRLDTPIQDLANVGQKSASRFKHLGIKTVRDLLRHFPSRYEDFSNIVPISSVREKGQIVTIRGIVRDIANSRTFRKRMSITNAEVEDGTGSVRIVWFNQPYIANILKEGDAVNISGKAALDKNGIYISSPSYEKVSADPKHTARIVPIYSETEGITSKYVRFLLKPLLNYFGVLPDPLPEDIRKRYKFPDIVSALRRVHFPGSIKEAESARRRFAFEELLLFQLNALMSRKKMCAIPAPKINFDKDAVVKFVRSLPFKLTNDQRIAAFEILTDLSRGYPMNRLLNGDVGTGKTVVALIAAYQASLAGFQAVMMAPTEILAKQHFDTLRSLCAGVSIRIGLLTGTEARQWPVDEIKQEKIPKKLMHKKIAEGEIQLLVGTHAVIQKDVVFSKLGLVVIDEQHRFGIEQRANLIARGVKRSGNARTSITQERATKRAPIPHLLSMTATPIPRTLALTIYGDLDVSIIKQKPKQNKKIITKVVPRSKEEKTYAFIDKEIKKGRQVFVICPRIEIKGRDEADKAANNATGAVKKPSQAKLMWAEVKAVEDEYKKLSEKVFPHRKVAMLHGRMKAKEKEEIMNGFRDGKYDILVSTSVIEVGVDVPNATIMMIESADRFGLAQLHQFRGRVGRARHQSYCFLFTTSDIGPVGRRLRAMEDTDDGFKLAENDLLIRGPGEFAGVRQSGMPDLTMSSLADLDLIRKTRDEAKTLIKNDPALKKHPLLLNALREMRKMVHFE